jgi:hypothetical protein
MSTGDMYDDFALERLAKEQFGITVEVDMVIVRNVDVGHSARATVFLTTKNNSTVISLARQNYCLVM